MPLKPVLWYSRLSLLILALIFFSVSAWSSQAIRITDPDSVQSLARANASLDVIYQRDYGSYVWMVLESNSVEQLDTLDVTFDSVPDPFTVRIQDQQFDPADASRFEAARTEQGFGLSLVQFNGPLLGSDLQSLREQGMDVLQYYPGFTYLVWSDRSSLQAARGLASIRAVADYDPMLKAQPSLSRLGPRIQNINLHFFNSGDPSRLVDRAEALGVVVLDYWPAQPDQTLWNAVIEADVSQLGVLASLPEVIALSYLSPEPALEDESATQVLAGNLDINNEPFPGYPTWLGQVGLDGSGVTWATTDSGVWYGHGDYNARITGGLNYGNCSFDNPGDDPESGGGHGTHVTGIFAGDGTAGFTDSDGFLYGHGMAPGVSIFAQNPIAGCRVSWPPAGGWQVLSRDALQGGAIGSNNSWTSGEGTQHGYQATERTYDLMVLDGNFDTTSVLEPFMVVFSAGNSGSSGVTAPKEAKNVVVTGGTQTFRVSGNVDAIYSSSSRGPAVDGRILPTIAAPGQSVSSTRRPNASSCGTAIGGTSGEYSFCTGTSMAAPHASGALILLSEWWRNSNAGADFSPAMGKALLINSATALSGSTPPNNDIGWGRIDVSQIVDTDATFEFIDQTELFTSSGDQFQTTVGVVEPSEPLKITLVWSDAPGAIGANPAIVNDLDLTVVNGGDTYLGNQFNNGLSVPGGSADRLNNIEQVLIENPGNSAVITVDAFQIAGSVLLDQPGVNTAQHFALVCQNCLQQPDFTLDISPDELSVCLPGSATVQVDVGSLLGFNDPVNLGIIDLPSGISAQWDNAVPIPPASQSLDLTFSGVASPGSTTASIQGTSTTGSKLVDLELNLFDAVPTAATLLSPTDGVINIDPDVQFSWDPVPQAGEYVLEISTDPNFGSLAESISTDQTSATVNLDTSTEYYWRLRVVNACGEQISAMSSFVTRPEPGDCPIGIEPLTVFSDDVETGDNGWTLGSGSTANTWQRTDIDASSGDWSWHAENLDSISDQRLVSPAMMLPGQADLPITLRFENRQVIEDDGGTACWDGAILEISTDSGSSWQQIDDAALLSQGYTGTVNNFAQGPNPLLGLEAWCGDPAPWQQNVVNLSGFAGEEIQLRFRLGSDGTVGREGWYIDDVRVESCRANEVFMDGFEGD